MHEPILSIRGLTKTYKNGPRALDNVDLDIRAGKIFALLVRISSAGWASISARSAI
jgi:ABC-type multidrug transport system ATPase subunit